MRIEKDVIIIGAGAAGLAAAAEIARAGRSALLIEARERIGGRIWSHHEPGLPVPIELGAEFIHGCAQATFSLIGRAASAAVDTGGEHWSVREGELAPSADLFAQIRIAMQRSKALEKRDLSLDAYLERLGDALSEEARTYARRLAEGFDAADPRRASARAIAQEWAGGSSVEAPQFRPLGGYGTLLAHLAGELRASSVTLQLDTVVRTVRWSRGAVDVRGTFIGRAFAAHAKCAVVTLPLGVLQRPARTPGAVHFAPSLRAKRAALERIAPGPVLKVLLRFRSAFWEEIDGGRFRDVAFFHSREARFPTFWTALPVRTPLLVAWAAGPAAQALSGLPREDIIVAALESLGALFGHRARPDALLEGAWVHDWQNDPFARGAYSYLLVGGDRARAELAKPLEHTLFFAGEATDTEDAGTVAGALNSGRRAAVEVLQTLRGAR